MIKQEINFYRHFKPKQTTGSVLSWRRFWILNGVILALLFATYIISLVEVIYLRSQNQSLQKELVTYQTKFEAVKKTFPQLFFSDDINQSVADLKQEIAAQERIVSILSKRDPFSDNLIALSQSIIPNVWLTRIQIQNNGDEITLDGNSFGISNLHHFISKLNESAVYSKYEVDIKGIKNTNKESTNGKISFELHMVRTK